MPLTDPELDLLLEMLEEAPADEAFLQVGEELVRRGRWDEAESVLSGGLAQRPQPRGFALLARASLETGRFDMAFSALERVDRDPETAPESARVEILALERAGRLDEARDRANAFLAVEPGDVVVQSALERIDSPLPAEQQRAHDPFCNVARAERYAAIGRPDRAVRAYRRILLANPGDARIAQRIRQLTHAPVDAGDDLSEDLTDPGLVPAEPSSFPVTVESLPPPTHGIDMPLPSISTATPAPGQRHDERAMGEEDEDDADVEGSPGGEAGDDEARLQRRRRRSLIRK